MELQVADNPEQEQYEIRTDGELIGFVQYRLRDGVLAFVHTETDPRFRRQGVAGRLVQSSLDAARDRHLAVLPYCPFVRRWVAEHPEYADLVPEDKRPGFGLLTRHRGTLAGVLEHVTVTRYVTPLREGGSLPAIVEADNLGTYVMKFRGAGQGPLALVAEIIAGELARRLGLRVPDLVLADLDPRIPGSEPDPEIQDLLRASEGLNLGVDFLPGSAGFDPLGWAAGRDFASQVLWFDALVQNVDRTWRNPNLLVWHGNIWLIDHGAALYFHHNWPTADPRRPFDASEHVLRDRATGLAEAHAELAPRITEALLKEVTDLVPGEWFGERGAGAYAEHLLARAPVVPEVIRE